MAKLTLDKWYLEAQMPDVQWQPVFGCETHFIEVGLVGLLQDTEISQQSASKSFTPGSLQWMPGSLPSDSDNMSATTHITNTV